MALTPYDELLNKLAGEIHNQGIRNIMQTVSKNRMYPKDCLTNGALEKLLRWMIETEAKALHS